MPPPALEFKTTQMQTDWPNANPDLRSLLAEFVGFSVKNALPSPVVTDLFRSLPDQVRIYVAHYRRLQTSLVPGPLHGKIDPEGDGSARPLLISEVQEAKEVRDLTQVQLEARAAARFTWHWARCAVDLRSRHYSQEQLTLVRAFFTKRCYSPVWEFVVHDVTAPHIHVARRDFTWRTAYGSLR